MRPGRPRETGPCVTCDADDWGDRRVRYRRADGSTAIYRSRYCKRCSRRRAHDRTWNAYVGGRRVSPATPADAEAAS